MAENSSTLVIGIIALVLITAGLTYFIAKSGETATPIINQTNQSGMEKPTITARGEATKSVMPDLLSIGITIEGNGSTVKESQADAAAKVAKIKKALLAKGVKESDIHTNSFYTQPVYNESCKNCYSYPIYDRVYEGAYEGDYAVGSAGSSGGAIAPDYYPYPYCDYDNCEVIGYKTYHSILIESDKVNEGGALVDAATSENGSRFDYVYFSLKEETRISVEEELQGAAAAAAKAKATKIAQGVGAKLGKIVSINPDQYYYPYPYYDKGGVAYPEGDVQPPTEIFPSETTMSSSIVVVYELEQ
jgi:uncharacterized protein YggE